MVFHVGKYTSPMDAMGTASDLHLWWGLKVVPFEHAGGYIDMAKMNFRSDMPEKGSKTCILKARVKLFVESCRSTT